ncbi:MAG: hypothetical protein E6797_03585 [Escherichia coli]|nr:hypothetical protein [Escherichia coli]
MLKQQDMTETARVVFNELSVTEPATVGEIAQNTYLSRERCQLILTQHCFAQKQNEPIRDRLNDPCLIL